MSSINTSETTDANSTDASDRRNRVMTGELPQGFLRLDGGAGGAQQQQIACDQNVAQLLQAQQGAYGFIPANTAGKLSITITQAKLVKNYGLTKMDPYCRIRVGHSVFETPTSYNGAKNPRWAKSVVCYLPNGVDSMYVEIFDERSITMDERVAWSYVAIPQKVLDGETVDDWYNLSGKQGDEKEGTINLVMTFTALQNVQPNYTYAPNPVVVPVYYPMAQPLGGQQMGQPAPPANIEEDIKQVKEMFPDMDDEVIKSVLEANRGNKDRTIESLLQMTAN